MWLIIFSQQILTGTGLVIFDIMYTDKKKTSTLLAVNAFFSVCTYDVENDQPFS